MRGRKANHPDRVPGLRESIPTGLGSPKRTQVLGLTWRANNPVRKRSSAGAGRHHGRLAGATTRCIQQAQTRRRAIRFERARPTGRNQADVQSVRAKRAARRAEAPPSPASPSATSAKGVGSSTEKLAISQASLALPTVIAAPGVLS